MNRSASSARAARARFAALLLVAACGGEQPAETAVPLQSSGAEAEEQRGGGMEITGTLGTIPERKVHAALEPKLGSFQRCFVQGAREVEFIGGRMEFYFRVAADGAVEWVYPRSSTVGHRATEQCLLAAAQSTRFPAPQGGTGAEVAWSFEIDPPEDVRAPVQWQAEDVQAVLSAQREALASCALGDGGLLVTAYVAPGGQLLGAGASASSREAADAIDCALSAIAAWPLPDPGSYAAKVSFAVP
jgi:hypothetical protein